MAIEEEIKALAQMVTQEQDEAIKMSLIKTIASYKHWQARSSLYDLLTVESNGKHKIFIMENICLVNKLLNEK